MPKKVQRNYLKEHTNIKQIAKREKEINGQLIELMLFPDDANDSGAPLRPRHEDQLLIRRFDENILEQNFPRD